LGYSAVSSVGDFANQSFRGLTSSVSSVGKIISK